MIDLRITDLSKTPEDGNVDFMALTNDQWDKVKALIDEMRDEEKVYIKVDDEYIRGRRDAFKDALICLNGARIKAYITLANSGKKELECAWENVSRYIDMLIDKMHELKEEN